MEIRIRLANNNDVDQVVRIVKAVYDEYSFSWDEEDYHADLYDLDRFYSQKGDLFWIAEDESGVGLGVVSLCIHPRIPGEVGTTIEHQGRIRASGTDCSLERLYVHPEARRTGVGSKLTAQVVEAAKSRALAAMELWSDKRFVDAHRLYGRFGAMTVGERVCHDPDQSPEWGLVIDLTK